MISPSKSGFTKQIEALSTSTSCVLDSAGNYTCDQVADKFEYSAYSVVLPTTLDMEGSFSDSDNSSGAYTAVLECSGSGCTVMEETFGITFPCTFVADYAANHESAR